MTLTRCEITNNSVQGSNVGSATLTGCAAFGNSDTQSARYNGVSTDSQGDAVNVALTLTDDILYGDSSGGELHLDSVSVSYCDIQVDIPAGATNGGSFSADPLFVGAASSNLHLRSGSPCIRQGCSPRGNPRRQACLASPSARPSRWA